MMSHADLLRSIDALPGKDKSGGGRMASCPVHDDDKASLSIDTGDDGRTLLKCYAGCRTEDIVETLGGTMADLFPPEDHQNGSVRVRMHPGSPTCRPAAAGDRSFDAFYVDGSTAGQHRRIDDGQGGKRVWWEPKGIRTSDLALFRSWDLTDGDPVVVVEGERATLAVIAAGFLAVGTYGSSSTPTPAALAALRGHEVILWPDNDEPGRKHMTTIGGLLGGARIVTPPSDAPKGWDAADADPATILSLVEAASPIGEAGPTVKKLSAYQSTPVQWLWPGWLPRGTVTLFDGNPGEAKSTTVMGLIARITTGAAWPDGQPGGQPADVLIITREDDPSRVLRPRLEVAGADLDRVMFLEDEFVMPKDITQLRRAITRSTALVFIDPLFSHIEGRVKTISDNDVRTAVMTPLSDVAASTNIALLAMRHYSKDTSQSALLRGSGSLGGLAGAARSVWSATADPDDDEGDRKLFGVVKSNYARKPPAYKYRVVSAVPPGEVWVGSSVSMVEWLGPSELSIDDVLSEEDHESARDATKVLIDYIESQGGSAPASLTRAHMKSKGYGSSAFKSAKKRAGAYSSKDGFGGGWTIRLDEEAQGVGADPFEGVDADHLDSFGANAEGVDGGVPPSTWTSSTPWSSSKESKETKGSKERVPRARARVGVDCRDYSAHQSYHRRLEGETFTCDACHPPEEEA